jgi:hypothetical protein
MMHGPSPKKIWSSGLGIPNIGSRPQGSVEILSSEQTNETIVPFDERTFMEIIE